MPNLGLKNHIDAHKARTDVHRCARCQSPACDLIACREKRLGLFTWLLKRCRASGVC